MLKKYMRKMNIYTVLFLATIILCVMLFLKNYNSLLEKFGSELEDTSAFDIPNIKKWKYDKTNETQKWNEWSVIKRNGYSQKFSELQFKQENSKMTVVFMFHCQGAIVDDWRNIFHFTNTNENFTEIINSKGNKDIQHGDRIPAVWLWPKGNNLHIRFSTENSGNDGYDYLTPRPMNIPELVCMVFDENKFTLYMNGSMKHSETYNNIGKRNEDCIFYIGDKWHNAYDDLFVKNFTLYDGALTAENISAIYNSVGRGPVGVSGKDGKNGDEGKQGVQGPTGSPGAGASGGGIGPTGPSGKDGTNGKDGTDGKDGTNGINGKEGDTGKQGSKGEQGQSGSSGQMGPTGPKGEVGQSGAQTSMNYSAFIK